MKREKDIQDPIMHTHTGQRRIPERLAIINHIAQFWNPDRHPEMYYTEPKPRKRKGLLKIVRQIQMAPSIRNVKSLTRNAYESRQTIADWNQQVIQQTAKKRKETLRKGRKAG